MEPARKCRRGPMRACTSTVMRHLVTHAEIPVFKCNHLLDYYHRDGKLRSNLLAQLGSSRAAYYFISSPQFLPSFKVLDSRNG